MLRQNGHLRDNLKALEIGLFHLKGHLITTGFHRLNPVEVSPNSRSRDFTIHEKTKGELDVLSGQRAAISKPNTLSNLEKVV